MNRARIKRLRDHLASIPAKRFNLANWFSNWTIYNTPKLTNKEMLEGSCGTSACIAGHALALFAPDEPVLQDCRDFTPRAAELLGLDDLAGRHLFEPMYLGEDVSREDITNQQAVETLDRLLETRKVTWS